MTCTFHFIEPPTQYGFLKPDCEVEIFYSVFIIFCLDLLFCFIKMVDLESELVGKQLSLSQPSALDISRSIEVLLSRSGPDRCSGDASGRSDLVGQSLARVKFCSILAPFLFTLRKWQEYRAGSLGAHPSSECWLRGSLLAQGIIWLHADSISQ